MQTLLTSQAVARMLDVSVFSIRDYANNGSLRHIRDSEGNRLFREADVRKFKERREAKRVARLARKEAK